MASQTLRLSHRGPHLWLLAAGIGLLAAAPAAEAAVTFSINNVSNSIGAGYGVDANENGGTKLDVLFTQLMSASDFTANAIGEAVSFDLGTLELREPNAQSGITSNEIDQLAVSWTFTVRDVPTNESITRTVSALPTVLTGSVSDSAVDYALAWSPLTVSFASGLELNILLNALDIATNDPRYNTKTQTATITLRSLPPPSRQVPPPTGSVPEPSTIALFALGLAGIGAARRKKPVQ
jgi:hypothetical protein